MIVEDPNKIQKKRQVPVSLEGRTLFLLGKRDETKAARKAIEEELVLVKKI